jgi:hypothetical protein
MEKMRALFGGEKMYRWYQLTHSGLQHQPEVEHNIVAWGAIKELLRINDGIASDEQIKLVLKWCGQPDPALNPNVPYLGYAIRNGWLTEVEQE